MSDDPDYNPNLDWYPLKPVYGDDVLVDDVGPDGLGRNQPFWKVCCGTLRRRAPRCFER